MPREIAGVFAGEGAAILPAGGHGRHAEIYGAWGVCQDMRRDAA
jgi:hypothetical protein